MSALARVQDARTALDEAQKGLRAEAKGVVEDILEEMFKSDPTIQKIEWAQKASEYNDEGMYPGVFGPVINDVRDEEDYYIEWVYEESQVDPRAAELKTALNAIGDEVLSEIYGDSSIATVIRIDDGFAITTEYEGP